MNPIVGVILLLAGLFAAFCAVANWDWFFELRKAQFFVSVLGRTGARIFYAVLGAALVVLGLLGLFGVISQ